METLCQSELLADCRSRLTSAGCDPSPAWARGALLLVPCTEEQIAEAGVQLKPHHILMTSADEGLVEKALSMLPHRERPQLQAELYYPTLLNLRGKEMARRSEAEGTEATHMRFETEEARRRTGRASNRSTTSRSPTRRETSRAPASPAAPRTQHERSCEASDPGPFRGGPGSSSDDLYLLKQELSEASDEIRADSEVALAASLAAASPKSLEATFDHEFAGTTTRFLEEGEEGSGTLRARGALPRLA